MTDYDVTCTLNNKLITHSILRTVTQLPFDKVMFTVFEVLASKCNLFLMNDKRKV